MGLFDRFKTPKWKHDDWKVRLEAVKELNDQQILEEIAKTDSDADVRKEAINKINDDSILANIVLTATRGDRFLPLDKIKNNSILAQIAIFHPEEKIGKRAVHNITSESELIVVAKKALNKFVRREAIEKINDDDVLKYIVKNDSDVASRWIAIRNISDESFLIEFAKNDSEKKVREEAVKKISNESVLKDISINEEKAYIAEMAVEKISDESILIDIVKSSPHQRVCSIAVKNISDDSFLRDIAIDDNQGYSTSREALEKINDKDILIDISKCSSSKLGVYAIHRIDDETILEDLAKNAVNPEVRSIAVGMISNVDVLKFIASTDSYNFRIEAHFEDSAKPIFHDAETRYPVREAAKYRLKELGESSTEIQYNNTSSNVLDYYCENCFTDIPKNEYCPHCGSTNVRKK